MRKKRNIFIVVLVVLILALTGGTIYEKDFAGSSEQGNGLTKEVGQAIEKHKSIDEQVDDIVEKMSLKEKIGQMIMIGVQGTDIDEDSKTMIHQFHFGGIVLFDRNLQSAEQTKQLIAHLQDYAQHNSDQPEKVPLFIGIDEEGGDVVRGSDFIPAPLSQKAIGATGDSSQAETSAAKTGENLKKLGINVNFAPVADVGSPDNRSFSTDADVVTDFVGKAADGYEKAEMMYAFKHFPGIGKGTVDSHQEVSTVDASKDVLEQEDLKPFKAMIDSRKPENYFILVSHLIYPAFDQENSASQSKAIMTDLLRNQLGYKGIIITDDMEMGAVANHVPYRQLGVNAIKAGADMVMMCHEYEHEEEIYMGILDAVNSGEISKERINESVKRIVKAKLTHQLQ